MKEKGAGFPSGIRREACPLGFLSRTGSGRKGYENVKEGID